MVSPKQIVAVIASRLRCEVQGRGGHQVEKVFTFILVISSITYLKSVFQHPFKEAAATCKKIFQQ